MTSAQRQFLVKAAGIEGFFSTKSGGNVSAETSKHYDGGSLVPDVLASPAEAENITTGRGYKVERDDPIVTQLRSQVGRYRTTLSVTPTDADLVPAGTPAVYPDALLVGMNEPDVDAGSGDAATLELEWAIGSFR